jgi:hypothetical protein
MPTSTNPTKTKHTTRQTPYGFPRASRGRAKPPRRRPSFPGRSSKPSGNTSPTLIGRAQTNLPGRKPKSKKSGLGSTMAGLSSSLTSAKNGARARKPSKKGLVGIVAGAGLGAAAVAKRRRSGKQDEATSTPPAQPPPVDGDKDVPAAA